MLIVCCESRVEKNCLALHMILKHKQKTAHIDRRRPWIFLSSSFASFSSFFFYFISLYAKKNNKWTHTLQPKFIVFSCILIWAFLCEEYYQVFLGVSDYFVKFEILDFLVEFLIFVNFSILYNFNKFFKKNK